MSCINTHVYPAPQTPESNRSRARVFELPPVVECGESPPPWPESPAELFGARACGGCYYQPVFAPETPECDDATVTFRARINEILAPAGEFGFAGDGCDADFTVWLDAEGLDAAGLAAAYAAAIDGAGIAARAEGAVVALEIPRDLTACGCNLRLAPAGGLADATVLEQPACCPDSEAAGGGGGGGGGEPCDQPGNRAVARFQVIEPQGFVWGDQLNFAALALAPPGGPGCGTFSVFDAPGLLRSDEATDFAHFLRRALNGLQNQLSNWGKSTVALDPATGVFTLTLDRDWFDQNGVDVCAQTLEICHAAIGSSPPLQSVWLTQPQCCDGERAPCEVPAGFVSYEIEIFDSPGYVFGDPANDVVFNLDYASSGCVGSFAASFPGLRFSLSADYDDYLDNVFQVFNNLYSTYGNSYVERAPGTGRLRLFLDQQWMIDNFLKDPCEEQIIVCQFPGQPEVFQHIHIEVSRQPECCPPEPPCPPQDALQTPASDFIDLAFQLPDDLNLWPGATAGWRRQTAQADWLLDLRVLNAEGADITPEGRAHIAAAWVGADDAGARWQQIRVDPRAIASGCFRFELLAFAPCGAAQYYSEPYRKENCAGTLLIEAEYDGETACGGARLTRPPHLLGDYFAFRAAYRVSGSLERTGYETEREERDGKLVRSALRERWTLRAGLLPPYAAACVAELLAAPRVIIDGKSFRFEGSLNRNVTAGSWWALEAGLTREVCARTAGECPPAG